MPLLTQQTNVVQVTITKGLEGQDNNLDLLQSYFDELKAVTVEPSPEIDLLTFAACSHYFGVISIKPGTQQNPADDSEDAEGEPEEASLDAGYIASPPPPSSISSAASFTSARSGIRFETPEEEKVLKWREAFLAQLQEHDGEEEPQLLSKGKARENHKIHSAPEDLPYVHAPNPSVNDSPDDYINWPDDIPSDEHPSYLHVQDGELDHETEAYSRFDGAGTLLGREILKPEQFSSPVKVPEIRTDPKLEAYMYEQAIKFRDDLRAQRIKAYQETWASKPVFTSPPKPSSYTPIGIVYMVSSQNVDDPMNRGQLNIGVYVAPNYIEQPGLDRAIKEVVNEAFQDASCHRVQAIVVDHNTKFHTLKLYASSGFSREGIGRREFFSPVSHEWKDVFYFAILDTDWLYNSSRVSSSVRPRPKTLWDDLLVCQQREREELLRMEEKTLKRSNSIETIRDNSPIASSIASTSRSETSSVADSSMSADTTSSAAHNESPKRRRLGNKSGHMKEWRSRAPSSSASSTGTVDTMSTLSSEWELPARPTFTVPTTSDDVSPPIASASTGSWVMLNISK